MDNRKEKIADEGMVYTNGEIIGKQIFICENDSEENWHQIPEQEALKKMGFI